MKATQLLAALFYATFGVVSLNSLKAQAPAGWVVIPVSEYHALRDRANPAPTPPAKIPAEATLTRIDYELSIDGALAVGRARLTIDVLRDSWVRVPIPAGLMVRSAVSNGRPVALVPAKDRPAQVSVLLGQRGRSVVDLDVAFPVAAASGEERLSLPVAAAGVTRASIAAAAPEAELRLTGGFQPEAEAKHKGKWIAYAQSSEPMVFTWRRRVEQKPAELPLRARGTLNQVLALGEDGSIVSAEVELEVLQGAARQVVLAVPEGVAINQVPGAAVADWDVVKGQLIVNFVEPQEKTARFAITAEARLPRDGAMSAPLLRLVDVERESGGVAVEVMGSGEIKQARPRGLDASDPAALGQLISGRQSPSMLAYRMLPGGTVRALDLELVRYTQQAVLTANVEEARYQVLVTQEEKALVRARYAVRNNQRNFVRVTLPSGAALWSATLAGRAVKPGQAPDGSLLFPLAKGRAGEDATLAAVEVVYLMRAAAWTTKGKTRMALPSIDLPISRSAVVLYQPPHYRIAVEPGAFHAAEYEAAESPVLGANSVANTAAKPANQTPDATQLLVDSYRARTGLRTSAQAAAGALSFPAMGPSRYLVSELTPENQTAAFEISYQKDGK